MLSATDAQRQSTERCAETDGLDDNSGDKNHCGSEEFPETFRSQFEAAVTSQANTCETELFTFENMFSLALGHTEAVDGFLKECGDSKDRAQGPVLQIESEKDRFTKSFSSSKHQVKELLEDAEESSNADVVV